MISPYNVSDAVETAIVILLLFAGCMALLLRRPKTDSGDFKYVYRPLAVAALLLAAGTIGICMIGHRWDAEYIIAYLTLRRIEHGNVFRNFAFVAYALLSFGTATFILIRLNEKRSR